MKFESRKGITFDQIGIPKNSLIYRLESYKTLNPWYRRLWQSRYNQKMYAIVHFEDGSGAIYDVTKQIEEATK